MVDPFKKQLDSGKCKILYFLLREEGKLTEIYHCDVDKRQIVIDKFEFEGCGPFDGACPHFRKIV